MVANLLIAPYFSHSGNIYNPETGNYTEVDYFFTEPLIVFTSDDSRYSMEAYFNEENFGGLIESFENLYKIYAGYVGAVVE